MFLTYDGIFEGGSIVKERVNLGWGIWNPIGLSLCAAIPMQMRGAMRSKRFYVYLAGAICSWAFAILTVSRNALIFSTLTMAACVIIACFKSERKGFYRIFCAAGIAVALVGAIVLREKIFAVLGDIIGRGLSDNGRFELWSQGIGNFASFPIFGRGFFGYGETDVFVAAEFIPTMAHNTAVQLLSSMGIFGAAAYVFYRIKTLIPIVKSFSYEKLMLLITMLVPLLMSLLDNFIFYFYPTFFYLIALSIAMKISDEEGKNKEQKEESQ
jgi:O-antigen ligase